MSTLRAVFAALFIPALGAGLILYIANAILAASGGSLGACMPEGFNMTLAPSCTGVQTHYSYLLLCAATAAAGLLLIATFALASFVTGANRVLLSFVFPALSFAGLIMVAAIVTAQVAILAWGAYLAEDFFLGQTHAIVLWILAGIGVALGASILWRTMRMFRPAATGVVGVPFAVIEQPRLARLVQSIAKDTGARMPDNIVLGLETNFFATTAPVFLPVLRRPLTGQTLYLSLPLMRVLSIDEVRAVVGHELAHFSGSDTIYSRQFAPIYRGLSEAAHVADENKPYDKNPLLMPARLFLRFMITCFHHNAARSSRKRELRADTIGAKAATPADLGFALVKCGILAHLWQQEMEDTVRDILRGRFRRNMSSNFEDKLRFDVDPNKLPPLVEFSLDAHTPHPTDSHPTTKERLEQLGLNIVDVTSQDRLMERFFAVKPAQLALDNLENVEEILTQIQHQLIIGPRQLPKVERSDDEIFVAFFTAFLAHMVVADGVLDEREIDVAEREAANRIGGFDNREFRELCRHPDQLHPLPKLTEMSTRFLTPVGFELLLDMLQKVAVADGDMHEREAKIINSVRLIYDELLSEPPPPV